MFVIDVDNVNEALPRGLELLMQKGNAVTSRGMATMEMPGPVSTVYRSPTRRVLFDQNRDANPFFHLMESLWIIAGSDRVALPKYFMDSIDRFSDNGTTFHGAYGERLRHAFGFDQLSTALLTLHEKPDSRQVVLSIWNAAEDLGAETKDLPCNDLIMLKIRDGALNMTVCNRSNDAIWGAYGANVVQFSMLQEWLAASLDVKVGHYVQQSDSYHVYCDNPFWVGCMYDKFPWADGQVVNPYLTGQAAPYPLVHGPDARSRQLDAMAFQSDCEKLCYGAERLEGDLLFCDYTSTYFNDVVLPVIQAYDLYKEKHYASARTVLARCCASDWRLAMTQWIQRREDRAAAKEQA